VTNTISLSIGFVSSSYPPIPGGIEFYNQEVARALAHVGCDVKVATRFRNKRPTNGLGGVWRDAARTSDVEDDRGATVSVLPVSGWRRHLLRPLPALVLRYRQHCLARTFFDLAYGPAVKQVVDGVDVVHYSGRGFELLGHTAWHVARSSGKPFIITPHTHPGQWGDKEPDLNLYRKADSVIALTKTEQEYLIRRGVAPQKVKVMHHGVSVTGSGDRHRGRTRWNVSGPCVAFLGRQEREKGLGDLLANMPEVWERIPDVTLLIAGPEQPDTHKMKEAYVKILSDPRVIDLGFISPDEREDLLATCDILCVPSRHEAYGLVFSEAPHYGTPVVARALPALQELIGSYNGGRLIDNERSISHGICELLTDDQLRQRMGRSARSAVKDRTWLGVAEALLNVYEEAESQRGKVVT